MAHGRLGVYDGKIAGLYDLEETLGSGHFAVVKLARHVFTGEKVAVKVIDKTKLDEVSRAHLFQEVRCMKLVQHPNVVRLYEVIDTQTKLYLILELGDGGDLYDYIMKHDTGLSEQLAREYFRQIVKAIKYCHQLHVVHRDLKPENVVFFEKIGQVKLTDFGFSNKFCPGQKLETSCGSLAYSAPEILLGDSYDAPAVDIWSLGVILYMLVCGQPPFQEANDSETLTMIMDCKYTMPEYISEGCRTLISTMLVREPEKRATLQQIADNEWLNEGASLDPEPEYVPLASKEQVSEEDHQLIIQKIVNGNIATKDEILEALERNEYNHITATYFLLAERKLRAYRQEQAQRRKPELTLPVSTTGRLSPRTRVQNMQRDLQAAAAAGDNSADDNATAKLLLPPQTLLNVPRTPGADGLPTGRARKCSIVQEEDDDEDEGSGRDELSNPLNRRGSRSEGRLNIAVQDRIAESDRLKKECTAISTAHDAPSVANSSAMVTKNVDGISGVKMLTGENCDPKLRLGPQHRPLNLFRRHDVPTIGHVTLCGSSPVTVAPVKETRSNSIDNHSTHSASALAADTIVLTKVITDAATIAIPLKGTGALVGSSILDAEEVQFPKFKTMPSPTKTNSILNEIYEEGTDIGSSDTSATTTPRPVTRHSQFTNLRNQGQGNNAHRRTKFNKTRTASCSSSDDDDSENRKKRAHKIVDSAGKRFGQRRDSYDDSSDSQEPGNLTGGTSGAVGGGAEGAEHSTSNGNQENESSGNGSSNGHAGGKQQMGFRRNRAGRRKAGETRLRESQSLNRITEVQESDISMVSNLPHSPMQPAQAPLAQSEITDSRVASPESPLLPPNAEQVSGAMAHDKTSSSSADKKSKGFSARLLQGFKSKNNKSEQESETHTSQKENTCGESQGKMGSNGAATTTKKLKMLGKYFQVHKKICNIPIPKIFTDRGRLYKAQSCGSIVRDKINQNPSGDVPAVLTELMARDGNNNSNNGVGKSKSRGKIFNRRMKDEQRSNGLLVPNLSGQQRLLGSSEGDINRNMNLSLTSDSSLLVDGNNNSNSNEKVNLVIDRRQSTVEPLESGKDACEQNGLLRSDEFEFQDIDGSSSEGGGGSRKASVVVVVQGEDEEIEGDEDGGDSSTAFNSSKLGHLAAAPPPSGLCS